MRRIPDDKTLADALLSQSRRYPAANSSTCPSDAKQFFRYESAHQMAPFLAGSPGKVIPSA
jgi:hypothetical protein